MRYLLIGNGDIVDESLFADSTTHFIQVNLCRRSALLPPGAKTSIFITNTGAPADQVAAALCNSAPIRALEPTCIMARNDTFYRSKQRLLRRLGDADFEYFSVYRSARKTLAGSFRVRSLSLDESLDLELLLCRQGMPLNFMPSTGMIAYHWIRRRLKRSDEVLITGFSHEGWNHHPWALERDYIKAFKASTADGAESSRRRG